MTENRDFPREIDQKTWQWALEQTRLKEEAMVRKYRKPGDPPVISTVEGEILGEILEQRNDPPSEGRSK